MRKRLLNSRLTPFVLSLRRFAGSRETCCSKDDGRLRRSRVTRVDGGQLGSHDSHTRRAVVTSRCVSPLPASPREPERHQRADPAENLPTRCCTMPKVLPILHLAWFPPNALTLQPAFPRKAASLWNSGAGYTPPSWLLGEHDRRQMGGEPRERPIGFVDGGAGRPLAFLTEKPALHDG